MNNIKKVKFKTVNINDEFFESLKNDYPEFVNWYEKIRDREAYIFECRGKIQGLLILKLESEIEDYSDITPKMEKLKRLKICTFKVQPQNKGLKEEFFKIVIDECAKNSISEVYLTVLNNSSEKKRLIKFFQNNDFYLYGHKGLEEVYVKKLTSINKRE